MPNAASARLFEKTGKSKPNVGTDCVKFASHIHFKYWLHVQTKHLQFECF